MERFAGPRSTAKVDGLGSQLYRTAAVTHHTPRKCDFLHAEMRDFQHPLPSHRKHIIWLFSAAVWEPGRLDLAKKNENSAKSLRKRRSNSQSSVEREIDI